jgi:hypothetical protein
MDMTKGKFLSLLSVHHQFISCIDIASCSMYPSRESIPLASSINSVLQTLRRWLATPCQSPSFINLFSAWFSSGADCCALAWCSACRLLLRLLLVVCCFVCYLSSAACRLLLRLLLRLLPRVRVSCVLRFAIASFLLLRAKQNTPRP